MKATNEIQLYEFATRNEGDALFQATGEYEEREFKQAIVDQNPITTKYSSLSDIRYIYCKWGHRLEGEVMRSGYFRCTQSSEGAVIFTQCMSFSKAS